jgi:uncharacterized metal-binding protein YceD (DUF177 family)
LECFDVPRPLAAQQPEFSRPIEVEQIGAEGVSLEIAAEPAEREALARRFGVLSLDRLTASVAVLPVSRKLFRVEGSFEAEVVQSCVVTLEPVPAQLAESFSALFGEARRGVAALLAGRDEDDVPEPIEEGAIDIGETVAQHLALALDPYPRKPGANVPQQYSAAAEGGAGKGRGNPFAALGSLKRPRHR